MKLAMTKRCPRCGTCKPREEYRRGTKVRVYCQPCERDYDREHRRRRASSFPPPVEKRCPRCERTKPAAEFPPNRQARDGLNGYCRPCWREYNNSRYKYKESTPEKRASQRIDYLRNPDAYYYSHLRRRFGVDRDWLEQQLAAQDYRCAICRRGEADVPDGALTKSGRRHRFFHVDHDHVTGQVRRILCRNCNAGIGHFAEDIGRLTCAVEYLLACRATEDVMAP